MMVSGDYSSPTMKLDVWQKDMNAIADFAKEVGCPTPLFATTAPIYLAAMAAGRGAEDTGAVCAVLEEMALGVLEGPPWFIVFVSWDVDLAIDPNRGPPAVDHQPLPRLHH